MWQALGLDRSPRSLSFSAAIERAWRWRWFDATALAVVIVVIASLNLVWTSIETRPPDWDQARHLGDSLVYYQTISLAHPLAALETYLYYPPFFYWVADAFYAVFGTDSRVAVLSNDLFFLTILAFSTYGIGRRLWNRPVGLLAAVFVLTTPTIVSSSKQYMVDMPLAAMVALALYLLIRSENFSRRGPSLLFGLAVGLGLLTKWTFPIFLIAPSALAVVLAVVTSVRGRSVAAPVNIAGAAILAFAVCGLWYLHNSAALDHDLTYFASDALKGSPPIASFASLSWYFWVLLDVQLYVLPFLLFAVGVVFALARREVALRNLQPLVLIVSAFVICALLRNKDARYTMPMLPAVAVVATSWIVYAAPRIRRALSVAIPVYGAVAFLAISFGTSLLPSSLALGNADPTKPGITFFAQHGYIIGPPSREHWYQQQAFEDIAQGGEPGKFAFIGGDSIWFNTWGTRYYALKYGLTWVYPAFANFIIVQGTDFSGVPQGFGQIDSWTMANGEPLYLFKKFYS